MENTAPSIYEKIVAAYKQLGGERVHERILVATVKQMYPGTTNIQDGLMDMGATEEVQQLHGGYWAVTI